MNRRDFIAGAASAAAIGGEVELLAAPFSSTRLSVRVVGRGPDVILIPGLTSTRDIWTGTVAAVPGYRYHLVQVAGFGSDKVGGNAKGEVLGPLAAELVRYISANGLNKPAVVGHSMGGTLAMLMALRSPASIGRVMVVDMLPAPAGLFGSTAAAIRPLADLLRNSFTSTPGGRRMLENLLGNYGGSGGARGDPEFVARVTHELAVTDLTDDLRRLRVPLTVVYATPPEGRSTDPESIVRSYRAAYAGANGAVLKRVTNSGHMIMYDQPQRFRAELKAFLA